MSLTTEEEIPPIFQGLITTMQQRMEQQQPITKEELQKMLFNIRITEEQSDKIIQWLINKKIIQRETGGITNKNGGRGYYILCLLQFK